MQLELLYLYTDSRSADAREERFEETRRKIA